MTTQLKSKFKGQSLKLQSKSQNFLSLLRIFHFAFLFLLFAFPRDLFRV